MSLHTQMALLAVANTSPDFSCNATERGLIVCLGGDRIDYSEVRPHLPDSTQDCPTYAQATRQTPPLWLLQQLPNMTAAHIAREWNIQGATLSFSQSTVALNQGQQTAQLLLDQAEAEEVLLVAVNASDIPTATAWHLKSATNLPSLGS